MKRVLLCSIFSISACGALQSGHGSGSSGGDPLQTKFEEARLEAVAKFTSKDDLTPKIHINGEVVSWVIEHFDDLREDIKLSKHVWVSNQESCANTARTRNANIHLSIDRCATQITERSDATKLLIHESVHHFGVDDEQFADQVAIIMFSQADNSTGNATPAPPADPGAGPWVVGFFGNKLFNIEATESMHLDSHMYFYHPASRSRDICHFTLPKPLVWDASTKTFETEGTFQCRIFEGDRIERGELTIRARFSDNLLKLSLTTTSPFAHDVSYDLEKFDPSKEQ